jgi:CBS domain-containing protein
MPLTARDLMTPHLITCPPSATLGEAARLLAQHKVHALVVAKPQGEPLGVLSDIDLLAGEWLSGDADSLAAMRAMTARDLMTAPPAHIAAGAPATEAAERMRSQRVHRLLVVDGGRAVGVISTGDLVVGLAGGSHGRDTVADVMSRGIVVCRVDTSLRAAARAMTERRSRSLVVVDEAGRLRGVVTGYDLLALAGQDIAGRSVAELMHPPLTIEPQASLRQAADLMLREHVHRLVVVDPQHPEGLPLGLISTSDIIAEMAAEGSVWQQAPA